MKGKIEFWLIDFFSFCPSVEIVDILNNPPLDSSGKAF